MWNPHFLKIWLKAKNKNNKDIVITKLNQLFHKYPPGIGSPPAFLNLTVFTKSHFLPQEVLSTNHTPPPTFIFNDGTLENNHTTIAASVCPDLKLSTTFLGGASISDSETSNVGVNTLSTVRLGGILVFIHTEMVGIEHWLRDLQRRREHPLHSKAGRYTGIHSYRNGRYWTFLLYWYKKLTQNIKIPNVGYVKYTSVKFITCSTFNVGQEIQLNNTFLFSFFNTSMTYSTMKNNNKFKLFCALMLILITCRQLYDNNRS